MRALDQPFMSQSSRDEVITFDSLTRVEIELKQGAEELAASCKHSGQLSCSSFVLTLSHSSDLKLCDVR